VLDWLSQYDLALWTIGTGVLANSVCAMLGCYLVLRRMSLLGDAISHAVLPGIVIGALWGGQLSGPAVFIGAVLVGLLTAYLTHSLHSYGNVPEDASMGVVFTSLFAIGVILITQFANRVHIDASCALYGQIEFVPLDTVAISGWEIPRAFLALSIVLGVTLAFVLLLWKELKLVSFDPTLATAMGLSAVIVHYLLMSMVAVVTVASFEAVGSILVIAMLIVPASTAHLLVDRLGWMMVWAVICGVLSAVLGYWGAAAWNTSVSGMMAVVAGGLFSLAVIFAPRHGVLTRGLMTLRLALQIVREDILAMLYRAEEQQRSGEPARPVTSRDCVRFGGGGVVAWIAYALLRRRGLVRRDRNGAVSLTERGLEGARSLVRSHRLWESYLEKHFELPLDHLHEPASRIEHFIGPRLQAELENELQLPEVDPHGKSIPPRRNVSEE